MKDPAPCWPDGTPKSLNNAFTTPYGVPVGVDLEAHANHRRRSTKTREQLQAEGRDASTIHGLSKRADRAIARQKAQRKASA